MALTCCCERAAVSLHLSRRHIFLLVFIRQDDPVPMRRWGPGERIVFEPYSKELYDESFSWIVAHERFAGGDMGPGECERSVVRLGLA